jgi:acetylornithine deacetylase/succinyl-diaminopimelate desuccinylase-like protein
MSDHTNPLAPDAVEAAMDDRLDDWIATCCDLISIPSENPPGDTTEVADYLAAFLDERGVPHEVIAPREEMPNVVAQFEGTAADGPGRHLTFNGHLDTFPRRDEDRWERDPFSGEVDEGRIHGRGASDMYGGFTASLAAFCYLFEHRDRFDGTATIVAVSDEETGGEWGTEYLVENHPEYTGDAVVSGEPSSNGIVRFAERGRTWTEVAVRGESAHTCSVPRGVSAVETLMDLLADVRALPDDESLRNVPEREREVILDAREQMDAAYGEGATDRILVPRVNVGVVEGGEKVNLVAEHARAEVDVRLPIGTTTAEALSAIERLAADYPVEVTVDGFSRKDPSYSDVDHPIFDHLVTAAGRVRDEPPALSCALAGTDCAFYRERGVPCAVYGPTPHNLGSQNEYIRVDDFEEVLKAQAVAAAAYLDGAD